MVVVLEEDSAVAATTEETVMDSLTSEEVVVRDLPETNSTTVEGNRIGNNLSTTTVDRISTKEDKLV